MDGLEQLSREELLALVHRQAQEIAELKREIQVLRDTLAGRGPGNALPPFVKPSRKQRDPAAKKVRKKREHAFVRTREQATREVVHAVETCPDCGRPLEGGTLHYTRQVIDIPQTPVEIIDHLLLRRRCGICQKSYLPGLGAADGVVGQHRVGVRLMSLTAALCTDYRLPRQSVQRLLQSVYGVHLSVGEISEILHTVAQRGQATVASCLEEIRRAPYVHADETGWREDGVNGYLWSFSTPEVRYFHQDHSRGGWVARGVLLGKWEQEDGTVRQEACDAFTGVLICDGHTGYNWYELLQRCWDHLCRKLKDLKARHADSATVARWVDSVFKVYARAKEVSAAGVGEAQRVQWRRQFDAALLALTKPYLAVEGAPERELAEHIFRYDSEWFTFVQYAGVPSGNNPAERALRPTVIARKISGGTRSPKGSKTMCALRTLFGTWALNGRDTLQACVELLTAPAAAARASPAPAHNHTS